MAEWRKKEQRDAGWKKPIFGPLPRGGGVLRAKFLEEMYENKLEFPGGMGVQKKKPCGGSMDIFWNCTLW